MIPFLRYMNLSGKVHHHPKRLILLRCVHCMYHFHRASIILYNMHETSCVTFTIYSNDFMDVVVHLVTPYVRKGYPHTGTHIWSDKGIQYVVYDKLSYKRMPVRYTP